MIEMTALEIFMTSIIAGIFWTVVAIDDHCKITNAYLVEDKHIGGNIWLSPSAISYCNMMATGYMAMATSTGHIITANVPTMSRTWQFVLAHEQAHLDLGHTDGHEEGLVIDINKEKEADERARLSLNMTKMEMRYHTIKVFLSLSIDPFVVFRLFRMNWRRLI